MEDGYIPRELQLMPKPHGVLPARWVASPAKPNSANHLPVDLNLSIGAKPFKAFSKEDAKTGGGGASSVQALRWQAAEQNRLATVEKAYAERVRELTRREMELAEQEFERARILWHHAQEELGKAERMREISTNKTGLMTTEITCRSCRQRFRP